MGRVARARRLAVAAAYGGGGLGVVGAGALGLLAAEARLARRLIPAAQAVPPPADGTYAAGAAVAVAGPTPASPGHSPLRFDVLGDSSAAGFGVEHPYETPGAMLAAGLADLTGGPVRLRVLARIGAQSSDLAGQVTVALQDPPAVVMVMIGANDVTHRVRPAASVRHLADAVRRLREHDVGVVVGTCPDLGTIEPVAQPLRLVARRWSRQLAAAQTIAVVEAGGRTVSLGDILSPEFAARPREMFAADRFHPSAAGYRAAAMALLPSLCAVVLGDAAVDAAPDVARGEGLLSVAEAAVEAAETAGTEVSAAQVAGHDRGPRGRWTLLRHRMRRQLPAPDAVAAAVDVADG